MKDPTSMDGFNFGMVRDFRKEMLAAGNDRLVGMCDLALEGDPGAAYGIWCAILDSRKREPQPDCAMLLGPSGEIVWPAYSAAADACPEVAAETAEGVRGKPMVCAAHARALEAARGSMWLGD